MEGLFYFTLKLQTPYAVLWFFFTGHNPVLPVLTTG